MNTIEVNHNAIEQRINERGLTNFKIAKLVGLTSNTIKNLLIGRFNPQVSTIKKLAPILGLNPKTGIPDDRYNLSNLTSSKRLVKIRYNYEKISFRITEFGFNYVTIGCMAGLSSPFVGRLVSNNYDHPTQIKNIEKIEKILQMDVQTGEFDEIRYLETVEGSRIKQAMKERRISFNDMIDLLQDYDMDKDKLDNILTKDHSSILCEIAYDIAEILDISLYDIKKYHEIISINKQNSKPKKREPKDKTKTDIIYDYVRQQSVAGGTISAESIANLMGEDINCITPKLTTLYRRNLVERFRSSHNHNSFLYYVRNPNADPTKHPDYQEENFGNDFIGVMKEKAEEYNQNTDKFVEVVKDLINYNVSELIDDNIEYIIKEVAGINKREDDNDKEN